MDKSNVEIILAIGVVVMPIFFGFIVYKMQSIFVTKEDWLEWKKTRIEQDHYFKEDLKSMEGKIDKLGDKIDKIIMNK